MPLKRIRELFFFLFFFAVTAVFSQTSFPKGAILDEEAYDNLPRKAALAAHEYDGLPRIFSLKQYAPLPGDQADYGTCVAWAAAYGARTIAESVALGRMSQTETTQNVFSPVYVYRNIRPDDPECIRGAQIHWALDLMRDTGAVKMLDVERSMSFPRVELSNYKNSKSFPIAGYVTLFSRGDRYKPALITRTIKKSLVEGKPVIIGMNTPDSFYDAKDIWTPEEDESPDYFYGGHAMCVVGYDDNKGAFEILNSWGRKWGNGGYIWISYDTFVDFVTEGYEIIENLATYSDTIKFSGSARIEILDPAAPVQAALVFSSGSAAGQTSAGEGSPPDGYYRTTGTFTEGTQFRFVVDAGESACVYSFAVSQPSQSGNFYTPILMFPLAGASPLLNYGNGAVLPPGEGKALVLNAEAGTEYLITLYSKQPLDIQAIMRRFVTTKGSLGTRLTAAVGDGLLTSLSYNENEAAFSAEPDNPQAVAALVVGIEHR